jgi:hypothetical protein
VVPQAVLCGIRKKLGYLARVSQPGVPKQTYQPS